VASPQRGWIRSPAAILWILTGLNLLNYLDRILVAAVGPRIKDALTLSDTEFGFVGNAFMVGYFLTSPIFGSLGDRGRRKGLIALGVAIWCVATAATGLVTTFAMMLAVRFVVGIGEASYATLAPTIIDDLAPPARKNKWLSVFFVAIPVGSALGYVIGGMLEKRIGWRHTFWAAGLPGIVLALSCLLLDEPERTSTAPRTSTSMSDVRAIFRLPRYAWAVIGYVAYTFALGGFAFWAPTYLYRRFGMELEAANSTFGTILVVTGLGATFAGGWIGDRWRPGSDRTVVNLALCAITAAAGAVLAAIALLLPSSTGFFVGIALTEFALFLSTSPINVVLLGAVPSELRATAMAASIFAIHLFGDLVSPPLVGAISDATGSLGGAMLILPVAIALGAIAWWRGASCND
jgi:MFS family permease